MTQVEIIGVKGGVIWMPTVVCGKFFHYRSNDMAWSCNRHSDGSRPTLREIVLEITNDGDFQDCSIADAKVVVTREFKPGYRHTREWDIRKFPSIEDCLVEKESDVYWEILDTL